MKLRCSFAGAYSALRFFVLLTIGTPVLARGGTAISCDGVNDYVTFGAASALGLSRFTIETWFKRQGSGVATSTGYGGIDNAIPLVAKGRAEVDGTNQDMNYFLGIRASDNVLVADFEEAANAASPGLNHPIAGRTPITSGIWYHAAASFDGTKWQLFLNGSLESELVVGQLPRADSIQHASLASALNSTGVASGFFSGSIDEVRIWNYARSAAEIAANKDIEIASASGLIARWSMNEGSGTRITSSSGAATIGTLVNGPIWTAGFIASTAPAVTRGPYLQTGTANSVVVRWRTNVATDSRVRFGTAPGALIYNADDTASTTEHQVRLGGLSSVTRYYYSVGSSAATLASDATFTFQTAPNIGSIAPTRIWVLGDSGEGTPEAAAVRDAYASFTGTRGTDVWLMLGDNAYENGTDAEYQTTLFDMYAQPLRSNLLWPTIGNHDTAESQTPPPSLPYFNIFTLPANAEAGGVASGTNRYYSFDYGSIHFVCLDSMTSDRRPGSAMLNWLQSDLAATRQQWIIAYFHHAPYSRGVIDSDTDPNSTDMRANVLPILEQRGVDLVLCGHSHDYERSYLLNGHYGYSNTFTSAMIRDNGSGRPETGGYHKPVGISANQGTVYAVVGSSAETVAGPLNYPAMFVSAAQLGSLVLDVNGNQLDARFLRETGAIDDSFTIRKDIPNAAPTVAISSPVAGTVFDAPATITITANPSDSDGFVRQVDFYSGATLLGTSTAAPWKFIWSNVPAGNYALTAVATDNVGGTASSPAVTVTVRSAAPTAPSNLTATPAKKQIALHWNDNSGNETQFVIYRSTDGTNFIRLTALGANVTSYTNTGLAGQKTYFYRVTAANSLGESAPSNTATATTPK